MDIKELGNKLSMYENIDILLKETNEAWGTMGGGSWELEIPDELVDDICTSGDNEPAVREALKDERIRKQFDKFTDEEIDKIFDYDGFDMTDEEKASKTREEKEMYILWGAAWNASENSLDESVEDDVKDHKNLAPEVDADKLKKEIENKKEEKPKMALTKKLWKEITGKIELDKEDKKITKQVEESIASKLISELDSINEGKLPNGAFDIPDIKTSLKNDYLQGKLTAEEVAKELHKAGWKTYVPDEDEALKMIHVKESLNEDLPIDEQRLKDCMFQYLDDIDCKAPNYYKKQLKVDDEHKDYINVLVIEIAEDYLKGMDLQDPLQAQFDVEHVLIDNFAKWLEEYQAPFNESLIADNDLLNHDAKFRYQMLSRMQQDCEYFLGYGNGYEPRLWAGNVEDQIKYMKDLWNSFDDDEKPEWLSMEDIEKYEKDMLAKRAKNESSDEIVQAVADKRQADFDKALEDEIAAKDEVNAEHSRGSQLGTHISLGRFSKLHKDRLEKQKKLNRNKELMDARNKSKDESSDEIVNTVAEKRKEAARKAIAKMNIVNTEHDAELDKIQNKYSDEEIVAGKADAEIDAINAKYEPIETELSKPIKKMERNHELMKKRKYESKLNEKDDVVYELENIKTGHTVWSHSKRMPGYKWTGKQSKNTEPNYEDGGLK